MERPVMQPTATPASSAPFPAPGRVRLRRATAASAALPHHPGRAGHRGPGLRRAAAASAALLTLLALGGATAPAEARQAARRVVAVGDVHGAGDRLRTILRQTGLLDDELRWSGGDAALVQTGDFTDRGPQVREVMDLLMRLEDGAREAGGEVRVLLGNHETMNLMADVRDVTPEIFAAFASEDAEQRREDAWRRYRAHEARRRKDRAGFASTEPLSRHAWMRAHPPGFFEYMEALGPGGRYGRWLRSKPIAAVIGDTVFLHGGLAPGREATSVEALNDTARNEIERFDRHRRHLVDAGVILPFSTFEEMFAAVAVELRAWTERLFRDPLAPRHRPRRVTRRERAHIEVLTDLQTISNWSITDIEGPLWYRGFALRPERDMADFVGDMLARFDVARAVVGHSVTASRRIVGRFDERVFLIDTGMLESAYRGRASALELLGDQVTAVYLDERIPLDTSALSPR